jgi:GT2 family glycosyltransferase
MPTTKIKYDLTVSIVLYTTDIDELGKAISLINDSSLRTRVFLVDNSPTDDLRKITEKYDVDYYFNNNNIGYGSAHNLAVKRADKLAKYHLVMNADVDFDPYILEKAFHCMEDNPDIGLLSPMVRLRNGELQHFCRLLPNPFDLFARRFIPDSLKPLLKTRLDRYIMTDKDYSKPMNIPNLPGCFMFMRVSDFKKVNGFDEKIFLYVEDIDLTRRLHKVTKTIYYPEIEIKHGLARGSYKLSKLVVYHINSAIYYFNKWGWFFDKRREYTNMRAAGPLAYVQVRKTIKMPVLYEADIITEQLQAKA